jgi:hypothetical protein
VAQRIYRLALGYKDLNDHVELRRDPLLAVLVEKQDLTGEDRRRVRDQGTALAGKSTPNRMELGAAKLGEKERYKRIILDEAAMDRMLVDLFLKAHSEALKEIVLDLDSTDIPLHGEQDVRFLPRLLRALLLPAAVHRLWRVCVVRPLAAVQYRWSQKQRGGAGAHCGADLASVAAGADHGVRRFRLLSRRVAELVRTAGGGLGGGLGAKCPPAAGDRGGNIPALLQARANTTRPLAGITMFAEA